MQKRRLTRTAVLSKEQVERDERLRKKYATRPSLAELTATGDYGPVIKQGLYLVLLQFAAAMKRSRKISGLSLSDVAVRSGIDRAAISRIENAQAENPTLQTLERLARALGKRLRIELDDE